MRAHLLAPAPHPDRTSDQEKPGNTRASERENAGNAMRGADTIVKNETGQPKRSIRLTDERIHQQQWDNARFVRPSVVCWNLGGYDNPAAINQSDLVRFVYGATIWAEDLVFTPKPRSI